MIATQKLITDGNIFAAIIGGTGRLTEFYDLSRPKNSLPTIEHFFNHQNQAFVLRNWGTLGKTRVFDSGVVIMIPGPSAIQAFAKNSVKLARLDMLGILMCVVYRLSF